MCELCTVLDRAEISDAERNLRKERLQQAATFANHDDPFASRFFQLTHEIRSLVFLSQYGSARMACDSKHEAGADFVLNDASNGASNDAVYIECVCASLGKDIEKSGLDRYLIRNTIHDAGLIDYAEKNRLLKARLTNSLLSKVDFYLKHRDQSIPGSQPYIIFLSPGYLAYEWFEEEYGSALTEILFGRGQPTITINVETGKAVANGYCHENVLRKYNGAEINCNLFCSPDLECVSGVLLAAAPDESYTADNTFLFRNPRAENELPPSLFQGLVYWDSTPDGRKYRPWRNGEPVGVDSSQSS